MFLISSNLLKNTFPLAVLFIVACNFFQQFYLVGLFAIFPLYIVEVLKLPQSSATWYFHVASMFGSLFTLCSGILGDSGLGKFRTILYLSLLWVGGSAAITIASAPVVDSATQSLLTYTAILAIVLGCGGNWILWPLGGDQFPPTHSQNLSIYFSVFYYVYNLAALLSAWFTPILRHNYQCFDQDTCFPLAFLILEVVLIISLVVFVVGKRFYVCKTPERNVVKDVVQCASYALFRKCCSEETKKHWLDYAEDKYSGTLISDTKAALGALWWLLPVPVFWALDDQTGSTWVFQAVHMDGSLGWFTIKPDQMQLVDSLMTLLLVPLFDLLIYPQLAKWGMLKQPLERLTLAGLLAAASFALAGLLELKIQSSFPRLPGEGTAQLRVFNGVNCKIHFNAPLAPSDDVIPPLEALQILDLPQKGAASHHVTFTTAEDCYLGANLTFSGSVTLQERQASSLFLHSHNHTLEASQVPGFDMIDKTNLENPKLRILYDQDSFVSEVTITKNQYSKTFYLEKAAFSTSLHSVLQTGRFSARLGNASIFADIELGPAGIYTFIVCSFNATSIGRLITVTSPNDVHMLWQLPQYVAITVAEVMFSITGSELSYTQAPESMKSIISVAWRMTDALGNFIVMLVIWGQFFHNQVYEFMFYSILMFIASCLFKYISARYEYYVPESV